MKYLKKYSIFESTQLNNIEQDINDILLPMVDDGCRIFLKSQSNSRFEEILVYINSQDNLITSISPLPIKINDDSIDSISHLLSYALDCGFSYGIYLYDSLFLNLRSIIYNIYELKSYVNICGIKITLQRKNKINESIDVENEIYVNQTCEDILQEIQDDGIKIIVYEDPLNPDRTRKVLIDIGNIWLDTKDTYDFSKYVHIFEQLNSFLISEDLKFKWISYYNGSYLKMSFFKETVNNFDDFIKVIKTVKDIRVLNITYSGL